MKPVKPEEWRIAPDHSPAGRCKVAPLHQKPRARPGVLRRIFRAMMRARQRQAEREIARHFRALGGRMTDETERKLMEKVSRGRLF
jgi:hypothetical protein